MSPSSSSIEFFVPFDVVVDDDASRYLDHSYFIAISGETGAELMEIEKPPCPEAEKCGSCPRGRNSVLCPRDDSGVRKIVAVVDLEGRGLALSVETEREKNWYDLQKTLFPDDLLDKAPLLTRMMARWCFPEMGISCPMEKGDDDDARRVTFVATLFSCLADEGLADEGLADERSEIYTTGGHLPPVEALRDAMKRAFEAVGMDM